MRGLLLPFRGESAPMLSPCVYPGCPHARALPWEALRHGPEGLTRALAGSGWALGKTSYRQPLAPPIPGFVLVCPQHAQTAPLDLAG
jgi:hypothetical protein